MPNLIGILTAAAAADKPTFWDEVLNNLITVGLRLAGAIGIVVGAVVVAWLLRILIRRIVTRIVNGAKNKAQVVDTQAIERSPLAAVRVVQRTRTLGTILSNIVNVLIGVIAIILIVNLLFPGILGSFALLTAALGAGLGFGAQNIVKDVLNGIFIVAEDQIGIGDVVDLGLATGVVEYVSVRVTHVRDVNGTLWYVRNGEVTRIGNMAKGWSRVIIDVTVPADADVAAVEKHMLDVATGLANDRAWRSRITGYPELWGLQTLTDETLVLRVVLKTRTHAKDDVAGELRMRLKDELGKAGLSLNGLVSVVLTGAEGAQRVRGAHPPITKPQPVVWKPKKTGKKRSAAKAPKPAEHTEPADAPEASEPPEAPEEKP
ncbi:mechanosensitive ion channel family protein [Microbacterium terrisoli]|uniref:mechanosensitive ion channel family protein n=1 Tax=Microbacterium terrisoli TaxID=3242192 RepID=UPI00280650BC|nr:mechanosensitive ion channel domain-containing protein [Microbacterium protaetiae]